VMIGGNVVYARSDWYDHVTAEPGGEHVWAWGREMTLDTSYSVRASGSPPPRLSALRKAILEQYIGAGPIFA
jgi:hypothetical protein